MELGLPHDRLMEDDSLPRGYPTEETCASWLSDEERCVYVSPANEYRLTAAGGLTWRRGTTSDAVRLKDGGGLNTIRGRVFLGKFGSGMKEEYGFIITGENGLCV